MKHVIRTTPTLVVLASLAMTAAAQTHKHHGKKTSAQEVALTPAADIGPMVGTWTLRNGGKPRTDIKMVFRSNGTFAFRGPNWESAGNFRVQDHKLALVWTSVDGKKVELGTMKKDYPMAEDDSSFTIDKYTYFKLQR